MVGCETGRMGEWENGRMEGLEFRDGRMGGWGQRRLFEVEGTYNLLKKAYMTMYKIEHKYILQFI